ncbi:MAG TPA: hypothetical protein PKD53_25860 [Chloroflexaceae bacterium]|nr:hypothetical protein [Chloroflexaceae bacterium]
MPSGLGEATQMIGPIAPALLCWACLILTVLGLALTFLWTNVTAFARRLRNGQRKPTAGSMPERTTR